MEDTNRFVGSDDEAEAIIKSMKQSEESEEEEEIDKVKEDMKSLRRKYRRQ